MTAPRSSSTATSPTTAKEIRAAFIQACGEEGIVAEYRALGVRFADDKPRANGCLECFALFRAANDEDATPSAYVNARTGKYKDSKGGKEIDIWQVAADLGRYGGSWETARTAFLAKYGLSFKTSKGGRGRKRSTTAAATSAVQQTALSRKPDEVAPATVAPAPVPALSWLDIVHPDRESPAAASFIKQFVFSKRGFDVSSFTAAGGFYSRWPHNNTDEAGNAKPPFLSVVGVPVYGQAALFELLAAADDPNSTADLTLTDDHAVGAVIWQKSAEPFRFKLAEPRTNADGSITEYDEVKMRTVVSADGLINRAALQLIVDDRRRVARGEPSTITRIWKLEGPTDTFAHATAMPAELRPSEPIIACAGGSTSVNAWMAEIVRGYPVVAIHDLDEAGEEGAAKTCELFGPAAAFVVHLRLAGEVKSKHGADVRDFYRTGGSFDDLAGDLLFAEPFAVTEEHRAAYARAAAANFPAPTDLADPSSPASGGATGEPGEFIPLEADDDPHRLARNYLALNAWQPEIGTTLRFWRQEWHIWNGRSYVHIDPIDLSGKVNRSIKQEFDRLNVIAQQDLNSKDELPCAKKVSRSLVKDAVAAIQGECLLPSDQEAPFWIDGKGPWPANEGFATGSGIIHLASLVDGKPDNLWPSTANFFSPNAVHYGFPDNDPNKCPRPARWLAFLDSLWGDDEQQIQLLQEWMGYCLLPDTSQQKLLLFIGPKRSGKGTIARTLTQLVGENNVVNPRLSQFDKEYGMWPLVGKTVAIIGDARLSGRTDTAEIVETLLSVSGEDKQTVNRKHMSYVHTRLRTRFTILSNAMPDLQDTSGAFHSRCLLLETKHSFEGRENKHLEHELLEELPGILIWAIQGWARLRERGHFEQPDSSKNALKQFEYLTSPMKKFLDEFCIVGTDEWVSVDLAFNAYCEFCKSNKLPRAPKPVFARDLKSVINHMHTTQRRDKTGERFRVFTGFRLKTDSELYFDESEE